MQTQLSTNENYYVGTFSTETSTDTPLDSKAPAISGTLSIPYDDEDATPSCCIGWMTTIGNIIAFYCCHSAE